MVTRRQFSLAVESGATNAIRIQLIQELDNGT